MIKIHSFNKLSRAVLNTAVVTAMVTNAAISGFGAVPVMAAEESEAAVSEVSEHKWDFAVFGTSTNEEDNGYEGDVAKDSLRVYSVNGKGKIVPKSTDGIAYYYTAMPVDKNFTLTATGHVNNWFFSNGQEGFGIMAADRVGSGNSAFWNNSYAAAVTGYSYVNDAGNKVNMKIGVSAIERFGVNPDNLYYFDQQDPETIAAYYNTTQKPIEKYCNNMESGNYNIVGNSVDAAHPYEEGKAAADDYTPLKLDTAIAEITDFKLTLQKNNSGYFLSYEDEKGETITKKFFVLGDDPLTSLDADNIYLGFFAARNMDVTFDNISLTTIDPAEDEPAQTPENTIVDLDKGFLNVPYANQDKTDLRFYSNWDGALKIEDSEGAEIYNGDVKADEYVICPVTLKEGENKYNSYFTPDEEFHCGYDENHPINLYNVLESYDEVKEELSINYSSYAELGDNIYVAPEGSSEGDGTKENPFDLQTAAMYVQPGQNILLAGGVYECDSEIRLARGVDGTAEKPITLMADPESSERPVLDFMKTGSGLNVGGDYWNIKGFDVTNSADGYKGLQLSGSYMTAEDIKTYYNGNTGLQVTRYTGHDTKESGMWPHDVLVKNCTSYDNSDSGFEDADGFAAKLTVGDNVVFDGCIAHHNADDGWDLFAKSELGQIGAVTVKNSVAYMNGYIHVEGREDIVAAKLRGEYSLTEGFVADENGMLVNAGNGNGFKMGGEGLKGGHTLTGCYTFVNKANGVTSNSCPDIKIFDTIAYDNGRSNIALYTGDKVENTDFAADKIITFRKNIMSVEENIECKGAQDNSAIFTPGNYFYSVENESCTNSEGAAFKEEYFTTLDFDPAADEIERDAEGNICMNGFLELTEEGEKELGAALETLSTASEDAQEGANETQETAAAEQEAVLTPQPGFWAKVINAIKSFFGMK